MVGATLIELIVACALTLLVLGTAAALAIPAATGFHTVPAHADVQQRLRVAVEAIASEIRLASSGPAADLTGGPADAWPALMPCGWADDPVAGAGGPCTRPDVLTIASADRPLWVFTQETAGGAAAIRIAFPPGCPPGSAGCGFTAGDSVIVSDGRGACERATIAAAADGGATLVTSMPLAFPYARGAVVASADPRTYYVRAEPGGAGLQLRRRASGSDLPVLDHLAHLRVEYFGAAAPPEARAEPSGRFTSSYGPAPDQKPALQPDGSTRWDVFDSCAFTVTGGVPRSTLQPLPADDHGLASLPLAALSDGPWCPDSSTGPRIDLDLYRIRRVRVTVRVIAASAPMRGAGGGWFAVAGTGRDAPRLVPDLEARFDVSVPGAGR
jgi:hypothetical protein